MQTGQTGQTCQALAAPLAWAHTYARHAHTCKSRAKQWREGELMIIDTWLEWQHLSPSLYACFAHNLMWFLVRLDGESKSEGKATKATALVCCVFHGENCWKAFPKLLHLSRGGGGEDKGGQTSAAFKWTNYLCSGRGATNECADGQRTRSRICILMTATTACVCVCECVSVSVRLYTCASWSRLNNHSLIGANATKGRPVDWWMNDWMREWMTECTDEWMNGWMGE